MINNFLHINLLSRFVYKYKKNSNIKIFSLNYNINKNFDKKNKIKI